MLAVRAKLIAFGHPDATTPPGHRRNPWGVVIGVATAAIVAILIAVAINALGGR